MYLTRVRSPRLLIHVANEQGFKKRVKTVIFQEGEKRPISPSSVLYGNYTQFCGLLQPVFFSTEKNNECTYFMKRYHCSATMHHGNGFFMIFTFFVKCWFLIEGQGWEQEVAT